MTSIMGNTGFDVTFDSDVTSVTKRVFPHVNGVKVAVIGQIIDGTGTVNVTVRSALAVSEDGNTYHELATGSVTGIAPEIITDNVDNIWPVVEIVVSSTSEVTVRISVASI